MMKGIKKYKNDKWICDDCGMIFLTREEANNHEQSFIKLQKDFNEMFDQMMNTNSEDEKNKAFNDFIDKLKEVPLK